MDNSLDIAIIGMSCRFPGAKNIDEFWENLCSGEESISFFSEQELKEAGIDDATLNNSNYVRAAPLVENPELFDASFFGYTPREAQIMDPQHRFFLECSWEALEHAGYDANKYDGAIGVYGGTNINTYLFCSGLIPHFFNEPLPILIGNDKDFLTTRVSYKLNLTGPSINVQCGCSTSLVAVHLACQSLLSFESDMALAGGVTIRVPHKTGYFYQEGGITSPDGHCRTFDAQAQGTIFGSGVGIVVLKRVEDAIDDGDYIHGIIKGSAINNDGSSKVDYTAPSVNSQSEVVAEAIANADIEPETISYIEAHGTGTSLGDPVEILALTNAFCANTDKKGFCAVGSVKTNIGHLDTAAGIAGLLKTILALKNKKIPANLHFKKANPKIDFDNSPFYVNSELSDWNPHFHPRRAGVNSVGIGGTNVHVIVEESPSRDPSGPSRPFQLLCLSSKTKTSLNKAVANLAVHLELQPDVNIADVAYTLQVGKKAFDQRCMVVCEDTSSAIKNLGRLANKQPPLALDTQEKCEVIFMCSGQGSQYIYMGMELYKKEPLFRKIIDRCSEILQPHLSLDLRDILYADTKSSKEASFKLKQTSIAQPALFMVEYAMATLWMKWGVRPTALIGHSIGEYVAACLGDVFSLEDALGLVSKRGRLMQELTGGSMLAVFLSETAIQPFLKKNISLAAVNGPEICTVSGSKNNIEELEKNLKQRKVDFRPLHTSHAFHSEMMDPIVRPFIDEVSRIELNPPTIPFLSNVTGTWLTTEEATSPEYWGKHLRQTVRFSDGIKELLEEPNRILLEVGPGRTLCSLARLHIAHTQKQTVLPSIRHPKEQKSDEEFLLNTIGTLWISGFPIDWKSFYENEIRHRTPLPTYPFERKRYWLETEEIKPDHCSLQSQNTREFDDNHGEQHGKLKVKRTDTVNEFTGNRTEQILLSFWEDLLGVDNIDIQDDFFDLGGTSLSAVTLFSTIKSTFNIEIPLASLYKTPTIEGLAKLILKEEKKSEDWSSLVEIRSGSSKPFFLIHAAGGNVLNYRNLAQHLSQDQTIYGVQAQGIDGKKPFLTRIEDMAANYIDEIITIQPEGPYFLGGYCLGGTIALEMAQQLHEKGHKVAFLALLETYNWENLPQLSFFNKTKYYLQKVQFHWLNFQLLGPQGKKRFLKEKLQELKRRTKLWYGTASSRFSDQSQLNTERHVLLSRLWQENDRAAFDYSPNFYKGQISLFLPCKRYSLHNSPEMLWNNMVEDIKTYELPVYPAGMLVEPFVPILAEKLQAGIRNASSEVNSNNRTM